MNLSYDLKKRHPRLKRNVKFDEDSLGLFMDMQSDSDLPWKRIRPEAARASARPRKNAGPAEMDVDELRSLVGSDNDD